jgi:hypothetical protein
MRGLEFQFQYNGAHPMFTWQSGCKRQIMDHNIILIYIIIGVCIIAAIAGWLISKRTRKLVIFALLALVAAGIIFGILVFLRLLFPPPFY